MRFIVTSLCCLAVSLAAQPKNLPYTNMFTTSGQRAEFTSVRTGVTTHFDWSFNTTSDPHASHDYPVGGDASDTVSDWLFSPPLKITSGAVLAFKYYVYGITGSATPSDQFSIWYGKGNNNPYNGTYMMLADLTSRITSAFEHWQDTSFTLPSPSDTGYVVFRYRATNNWFTLGVDSISVIDPGSGIKAINMSSLHVMPNPCSTSMHISSQAAMESLSVIGIDGKLLAAYSLNADEFQLDIAMLPKGTYFLSVQTVAGKVYRKFEKY